MTVDDLIEEILVDAYGEGEQLSAFHQAFEDNVPVPVSGSVAGSPVSVLQFDFDGNERRGLTATCRGDGGGSHTVSAADVVFEPGTEAARYVAAYRKWLGLTPVPRSVSKETEGPRGFPT